MKFYWGLVLLLCKVSLKLTTFPSDNLKLFNKIDSSEDCAALQRDIDSFAEWCQANHLFINLDKCKVINFSKKKSASFQPQYAIQNNTLQVVSSVDDLGVIFNSNCDFSEHVDSIVKKASRNLGVIKRVTVDFSNSFAIRILYQSLVRNQLEYASLIYRPCSKGDADRIELVIDKRNNKDAETGMFELAYLQQVSPPQPYMGMNLTVRGCHIGRPIKVGQEIAEKKPKESDSPQVKEAIKRLSDQLAQGIVHTLLNYL
ncbi:hypothetical protein O3M35_005756 [Rhynocoris fuscipes]|uniref:Uncharacterized protein n=1 Tax=Rhynocoris fuscipes TaxID=488301 RepID=A0AAW1DN38_9HEMI